MDKAWTPLAPRRAVVVPDDSLDDSPKDAGPPDEPDPHETVMVPTDTAVHQSPPESPVPCNCFTKQTRASDSIYAGEIDYVYPTGGGIEGC